MKANLIRIGNSRGIRIPKVLIEQCNLPEEVELETKNGQIVIRPAHQPRQGWGERFKAMAEAGDDRLLMASGPSTFSWDAREWEW